jgi:DNA-binding NarL/FixJ family response regulator
MIRIIIADDHKIVRDGLRSILKQYPVEMQIAAETASGHQVLSLLEQGQAGPLPTDKNHLPASSGREPLD